MSLRQKLAIVEVMNFIKDYRKEAEMIKRNITLNGVNKMVVADPETSLADVVRGQLGLTGTKVGCGKGQCGSCSVIMDGKLIKSCITKMKKIQDGASHGSVKVFFPFRDAF